MQSTWLPKGLCDDMEKIIRGFVWGKSDTSGGIPLVKWETMQESAKDEGLGMKNISQQNKTFLTKIGFQLVANPEKLWVRILRAKYGWTDVLPVELRHFWNDKWIDECNTLTSLVIGEANTSSAPVAAMVGDNGGWDWIRLEQWLPQDAVAKISAIKPPRSDAGADIPGWRWGKSRTFTVCSAYQAIHNPFTTTNESHWSKIWRLPVPQRICVFMWLVFRQRLLTNAERFRRHLTLSDSCPLCHSAPETIDHMLRTCPRARHGWEAIIRPSNLDAFLSLPFSEWLQIGLTSENRFGHGDALWVTRFSVFCWIIWKRRCNAIFGRDSVSDAAWVQSSGVNIRRLRRKRLHPPQKHKKGILGAKGGDKELIIRSNLQYVTLSALKSIGSLGKDNSADIDSKVVLDTALLRETTNGVRIETWQGEDGIIDQFYCDVICRKPAKTRHYSANKPHYVPEH
ncbi:hypothetical protein GQ457_03G008110 [Hibiscus cannabinus]